MEKILPQKIVLKSATGLNMNDELYIQRQTNVKKQRLARQTDNENILYLLCLFICSFIFIFLPLVTHTYNRHRARGPLQRVRVPFTPLPSPQ